MRRRNNIGASAYHRGHQHDDDAHESASLFLRRSDGVKPSLPPPPPPGNRRHHSSPTWAELPYPTYYSRLPDDSHRHSGNSSRLSYSGVAAAPPLWETFFDRPWVGRRDIQQDIRENSDDVGGANISARDMRTTATELLQTPKTDVMVQNSAAGDLFQPSAAGGILKSSVGGENWRKSPPEQQFPGTSAAGDFSHNSASGNFQKGSSTGRLPQSSAAGTFSQASHPAGVHLQSSQAGDLSRSSVIGGLLRTSMGGGGSNPLTLDALLSSAEYYPAGGAQHKCTTAGKSALRGENGHAGEQNDSRSLRDLLRDMARVSPAAYGADKGTGDRAGTEVGFGRGSGDGVGRGSVADGVGGGGGVVEQSSNSAGRMCL